MASCKAESLIENNQNPEVSATAFTYPAAQYKYEIGQIVTRVAPELLDQGVFVYSVEPELPPGLTLDPTNGSFGGIALALSEKQIYTFKANLSGVGVEYQYRIEISVNEPVPQLLGYPQNPLKAIVGQPLSAVFPVVIGSVDSYSLSPALPAGLFFDPITGGILGTPIFSPYNGIHQLTATNSGGSATIPITIEVTPPFPNSIVYSAASYSCQAYVPCTIPAPSVLPGGLVGTEFSISPNLPSGYSFNTTTGEITSGLGDVILASPLTTYTVLVQNDYGSQFTTFDLETVLAAPTDLGYPAVVNASKDVPLAGDIIPTPVPINAAIETYQHISTTTPASTTVNYLPGGLVLDPNTGYISGTPSAVPGSYVITMRGTNSLGVVDQTITLNIAEVVITALDYPTLPTYVTRGVPIPQYLPTYDGSQATTFNISSLDPIPVGLQWNSFNGSFYGTPLEQVTGFNFSVTATNGAGTSAPAPFTLNISEPAPVTFEYPQMTYTVQACSDVEFIPSIIGGEPTSVISTPDISAADQFPATGQSVGLSIDQTTGTISGNISQYYSDPKGYIIQASNLAGFVQTALTIITTPDAPDFSMDDFSALRGIAQTHTMNLNSCFDKSDSTIVPALPNEFSLNETNDVVYTGTNITGVSPFLVPRTSYLLSLNNSAGSSADSFNLELMYRSGSSRNDSKSVIFDFDRDGNNDILLAGASCPIYVAGNCSEGNFSILQFNSSTTNEYTRVFNQTSASLFGVNIYNHFDFIESSDIDGDDYSDIIYYDSFQQKLIALKNDSGTGLSLLNEVVLLTPPEHIIHVDLDDNGSKEVIVSDGSSTLAIYTFTAGAFVRTTHTISNLSNGIENFAAAKINADDFIDLVILDKSDNSVCPVRGITGSSFETTCVLKANLPVNNATEVYNAGTLIGSFDDIVFVHENTFTSISVLRNDGNDFASTIFSTPPAINKIAEARSLSVGDLNLDGTPDISIHSLETTTSTLHSYNGASLFSTPAAASSVEYPNIRSMSFGEMILGVGVVTCHENAGIGYCRIPYSSLSPYQF